MSLSLQDALSQVSEQLPVEEAPNPIRAVFERSFMSAPLQRQIERCEEYELADLFRRWLPDHQPILEAGCGSGRWVAWSASHGWSATGLDWSHELCQRAQSQIPAARFVQGDIRALPFADNEFGAIISLGAVEHEIAGPLAALREFHRVLRPGGIAIITVPFGGRLRRFLYRISGWLRASLWLRRMAGKPTHGIAMADARSGSVAGWFPSLERNRQGWYFFEYEFSRGQMLHFLHQAGFKVLENTSAFAAEGLAHNFGRLVGPRWDQESGGVRLNTFGRVLGRVLSVDVTGHMLVFVVEKTT
ncbi:MAG: class I SAM-dependent methyltransferase [Candidatus Korobacteraceae bacterium]